MINQALSLEAQLSKDYANVAEQFLQTTHQLTTGTYITFALLLPNEQQHY